MSEPLVSRRIKESPIAMNESTPNMPMKYKSAFSTIKGVNMPPMPSKMLVTPKTVPLTSLGKS